MNAPTPITDPHVPAYVKRHARAGEFLLRLGVKRRWVESFCFVANCYTGAAIHLVSRPCGYLKGVPTYWRNFKAEYFSDPTPPENPTQLLIAFVLSIAQTFGQEVAAAFREVRQGRRDALKVLAQLRQQQEAHE